ncbi:MAG: HD domain-containing protein [Candidatus Pacebacteria bacterium]|nr:HD domain-containing protein [Candidatus Paceibacterota bacterium]
MNLDFIEKITRETILDYFPELEQTLHTLENNICHDQESVFNHTMQVFKNCKEVMISSSVIESYFKIVITDNPKSVLFLLAVLFHDISKTFTIKTLDGETSCPGHELKSSEIFHKVFEDKLSSDELIYIEDIIKRHADISKLLDHMETFDREITKLQNENRLELFIFSLADFYNGNLERSNKDKYDLRVSALRKAINMSIA